MTQVKFREDDRVRIRYHLGFLNVEPIRSIQLGFPSAQQAEFLVETAMDRIIPEAIPRVLAMLNTLDCIECQMVDALSRLKAQQLGELKLRNNNDEASEQDLLEREYNRWAKRLGNMLGVGYNPYAERFQGASSNVSVAPP